MERINRDQFDALIADARVLERQEAGLSALRSPDGLIIKIWQRRPGLSSDRFRPYSKRFRQNCEELNKRGVRAPVITAAYELAETGEHILCYPEIPGIALRNLAKEGRLPLAALAGFYADLHKKGVFFRSIHLGNVLRTEPPGFALIDVTDTHFSPRSLRLRKRAENLGYAWAYRTDYAYFDSGVRTQLLGYYLEAAGLQSADSESFHQMVIKYYDHYTERRQRR